VSGSLTVPLLLPIFHSVKTSLESTAIIQVLVGSSLEFYSV
jgi:hypothetical protein